MAIFNCTFCGKEYKRLPSKNGGYCSADCWAAHKRSQSTHECKKCGKSFYRPPSTIAKTQGRGNFCSAFCANSWNVGENNKNWAGGDPVLECVQCGKPYTRRNARAGQSKFCSRDCQHEHKRNQPRTRRTEYTPIVCAHCDAEFSVPPSLANTAKYCSRKCKDLARPNLFKGENNPRYIHGGALGEYPTEFNETLKEMIRDRDHRNCRLCGISESDCDKKLAIHHIDHDKKNNSPGNLISLCHPCHGKMHGKEETNKFWQSVMMELVITPAPKPHKKSRKKNVQYEDGMQLSLFTIDAIRDADKPRIILDASFYKKLELVEGLIESLGKESDRSLAERFDLEKQVITNLRKSKGIPKWNRWTDEILDMLGKIPDNTIVEKTGICLESVREKRIELGIPVCPRSNWKSQKMFDKNPQAKEDLGKISDREISKKYGIALSVVCNTRNALGIPHAPKTKIQWTDEMILLLGRLTDTQFAKRFDIHYNTVKEKRVELGIKAKCAPKTIEWTEDAIALLGTMSDQKVAERLGTTDYLVAKKRYDLGIPSYGKPSRPRKSA